MASKTPSKRKSRKQSPDANQLLVMELQQIHSAESQLGRMAPRFIEAAASDTLRDKLEERMQEGERIVQDVEKALDELEESPGRRRNAAAEGLINDLREHVQEIEEGPALDAVLIAGIQKTEHYCIAAWGTAKSLAQACDLKTGAQAMERALKEGKRFDEELTQLAEKEIAPALSAGEQDSEEDEEGTDEESSGGQGASRRKAGSERRTHARG
jgi:ferritin-like metal-binding protein YciE